MFFRSRSQMGSLNSLRQKRPLCGRIPDLVRLPGVQACMVVVRGGPCRLAIGGLMGHECSSPPT